MQMTLISDTHNKHEEIDCGSGDILIHAGDATGRGQFEEIDSFLMWFSRQDFTHKILIAGNHDWGFERHPDHYSQLCGLYGITYLNDSGVILTNTDSGQQFKIWGSPVQPEFCNWAFNRSIYKADGRYRQIKPHWDMIPLDTDILITHGPPWGMRDSVISFEPNEHIRHVGCPHLIDAVRIVKPKYHIFGHIHEQHGMTYSEGTTFINASQLDDRYDVTYEPINIQL
jgi:predicted phosphodiesterase